MSKPVARYVVTYGLSGCYMPDSHMIMEFTSRRELAEFIRSELEFYEIPASLLRDVGIRRLWTHIARNGSSSAHFSLEHEGYSLSFHGLTEYEYNANKDDE